MSLLLTRELKLELKILNFVYRSLEFDFVSSGLGFCVLNLLSDSLFFIFIREQLMSYVLQFGISALPFSSFAMNFGSLAIGLF